MAELRTIALLVMIVASCSDQAVELEDGWAEFCGFEQPQPVAPREGGQGFVATTPVWQEGCGAYQARVEAHPTSTDLRGNLRLCNLCGEPMEFAWLLGASEDGLDTGLYAGQTDVLHAGIQMAVVDIHDEVVHQLCDYSDEQMCQTLLGQAPFTRTWIDRISVRGVRDIEYSEIALLNPVRALPFQDYRRAFADFLGEDSSTVPAVDYSNLRAVRFEYPRLGLGGTGHVYSPIASCQRAGYPTATCLDWSADAFPSIDFPVDQVIPEHIRTQWVVDYSP